MWNVALITTRVYKSTLVIGVVSVHGYTISWNMAMISLYRQEIRLISRQEVVEERKQLFRLLNCESFFPEKSCIESVLIILHDYYLSGLPYTFFPTIFLQVAMCYEEFLIQSVRQFDKSINHTFSLQSINKSIRLRVEHYLEHAPIIVIFDFFLFFFLFFVFCFVFALFVLVGWVVSFSVVLFWFFVCLFHLSAESSTTSLFFFSFFLCA